MPLLRTIGGRVRDFRMVKRAVKHHGQRIAELLEERVNALLPENRRIDFWLYMNAIVDLLRLRCDRLTGAEHDLVGERGNDPRMRKERDQDSDTLRTKIIRFRDAFESIYLPVNLEEFGFPTILGATSFEVLRQADHLVEIFSRPSVKVPDPQVGTGLPISELVTDIKTRSEALRSSLDATDREVKLAELAVIDKDDAAAGWDELLPWAVRTIKGLFILAGQPALAAKVLPALPRRSQSGELDGGSDGSGDEGSTSEPPAGEDGGSEPPTSESSSPAQPSPAEPSSSRSASS